MPNHVYAQISGISTKKEESLFTKIAKKKMGLAEYLIPFPEELENTSSPSKIVSEKDYLKQEKQNKLENKVTNNERIFSNNITQAMSDNLKDKYLFDNWYDWNHYNYGTKWGCYDNNYENGCYSFTTAWSPLHIDLIERLAKIHPTFTYSWEEETGWGGWMRYEDGVCVEQNSFECPNWYEDDFDFYIDKLGIVKVEEDISPNGINPNDKRRKFPFEYDYNGKQWEFLVNLTKLVEPHTNLEETYDEGYYDSYDLNVYYGKTIKEALESVTKDKSERVNLNPVVWG
jgi:hypothetical protein